MGLFQELRRRKVTRIAAVYVVTAWLLLQVVDVISDPLHLPDWFATVVVVLLILGLPLALVLAWAFEVTPDGVRRASSSDGVVAIPPGQSRMDYVIMGLLVMAIGFMVYTSAGTGPAPAEAVENPSSEQATPAVLHNSIAVLPFENMSPDPNNAYFALGMHEEILNQLAKIRDLSVLARTTMTRYANSDQSVPDIGRELNVGTVMEGSVRFAGNRVRITAQLIDVASGAHLWSEAYDRDLEDVFSIQSDIALNITDAMKVEFDVAEREAIAARPTNNIEAYAEYVKALQLLGQVPMPMTEALGHLERALDLDPGFAKAWGYASEAYGVAALLGTSEHPQSPESQALYRDRALEAANRAMALNPNQSNAHVGLVYVANIDRRWDDALALAKKAHEVNPGVPTAVFRHAFELANTGQADEVRSLIDRAMQLDPLNANYPFFGVNAMFSIEQWDDVLRYARQTMAMVPASPFPFIVSAFASHARGDYAQAQAFLAQAEERTRETRVPGALVGMMTVYSAMGMTDEVQETFTRFQTLAETYPVADDDWSAVYRALGDAGKAMKYTRRMVERNFPNGSVSFIAFHSDHMTWRVVRDHPDFEEVVRLARTPIE